MTSRHHKGHSFNTRAVVRTIGMLLLIEALFMSIPTIVSACYHEDDFVAFLISCVSTAGVGLIAALMAKPRRKELGRREGVVLTASVWIVFSLFGMLPFILSSLHFNISQAFFESMSGFTTTGASVMEDISHLSKGVHLWRCLMQWIGGMGIVIFTIAVIPLFNSSGGMQMFFAESTGYTHDKLRPRVSQTAKRLWGIYTILTLVLGVLLYVGPMDLFDSICHALSTVSTGGFSTHNDSLDAWNSLYVKAVVMIFMFIGGVNFALIYRMSIGKFRLVWKDETFRAYCKIIIAMTLVFTGVILFNGIYTSLENVIVDPMFQVVSTISSTGYAVANLDLWAGLVFPCLIILMFVGACAGSTSGGAKIDRMLLLWKNTKNVLNKNIHPNRFYPLTISGRSLSPEMLQKVCAFIFLYFALVIVGALLLSLMGIPIGDSCFAAFSCIANTGVGGGVTSASFEIIPDAGKWVLSFIMLIGRLEIFTILILLSRAFWVK